MKDRPEPVLVLGATEDQQRGSLMKKSGKQGKRVFSVKRVRGGVPASSSVRG